ncbi:MAG: glycosyltransferase [Clostridia bacterium]|nr:MAG: glycosyltransferase [Clostridia bacterium]
MWQANSGKHVAINRGVSSANGYFFVVVDSDDWLSHSALERLLYHWETIPEENKENFAGVVGLYADPSGKVIGTIFPHSPLDSDAVEIRTRYRVMGDNFGMNRTDILKQFPFPEDLGKFVTEALVWNRIAKRYKLRFVNEIVAYKQYQSTGLTASSLSIRARSPRAARLYYQEYVSMDRRLPLGVILRNCANYVRFSLHERIGWREQVSAIPSKLAWTAAFPIGTALYWRDRAALCREAQT